MLTKTIRLYDKFRAAHYSPIQSKKNAAIVSRWDSLKSRGLVRLIAEPQEESYFSVYGEPDGYTDIWGRKVSAAEEREQICDQIDRLGLWTVSSEFRMDDQGPWETAYSYGMCYGYSNPCDPLENPYVVDLMDSAIRQCDLTELQTELQHEVLGVGC